MGFAILSIFLLALLAPVLGRLARSTVGWLMGLLPLALTAWFLFQLKTVAGGEVLREGWPWLPALGIELTFFLDGLSLLFALLICGVGSLIMIYSGRYLAGHRNLGRFFLLLNLFMASMLGLVLAGNLITLFVFWELTSLTSFFLIGFEHQRDKVPSAALQALLVTGLGGLALLAGLVLLGEVAGTLDLAELRGTGEVLRQHGWYTPIVLLMAVAAFTKSAQFPVHFWLPNAMEAPTPVSAYLHSVTMVKAGIYLLLRLSPVLGGTPLWQGLLEIGGGITMLGGILLAFRQTDLKRLLAYTTISSLGLLVFLIGLDFPRSLEAALVYLLAHALYKAPLFLATGAIGHATGHRDLTGLGGLFRQMPQIAVATMLAAVSMAGIAPLIGFIGKELVYEVVLAAPRAVLLSTVAAFLTSMLTVAVAGLIALRPFFGPARFEHLPHGRIAFELWLGPLALAAAGIGAGLLAGPVGHFLLAPAVVAVLPGHEPQSLALWHGFTPILAFSALTLICGALIFRYSDPLRQWTDRWIGLRRWGPEVAYEWFLSGLFDFAARLTGLLQNGRLRYYLLTVLIAATLLVGGTLLGRGAFPMPTVVTSLEFGDLILAAVILAAAWVTARVGERLVAIVAMGVVGYGIALVFAQFGAPDLAMTQFSVETITVLLFVLIFHRLPLFSRLAPRRASSLDAAVAAAAGLLMTVLTLVALSGAPNGRISGYFSEQSVPAGHGRNIVNTILVDFRALDTMGEITVLGMAGLGVWALLKLFPAKRDNP